MIVELAQLRDRERVKEVRAAYQVAIDRLHSLIYRLNQPQPRTIGLPTPPASAPSPEPDPSPLQPPLPLGPVIVRANKPRRR